MLSDYDPFATNETLKKLATEPEPIKEWDDLLAWMEAFKDHGCFRGERDASWNLASSLDRAVESDISAEHDGISILRRELVNLDQNEQQLLLDFQRGASRHHPSLPDASHTIDWLALMQHHGAPTRLLDWSLSPYVAVYFALEKSFKGDSALWGIDLEWLRRRSLELMRANDSNCPDGSNFKAFSKYVAGMIFRGDGALTIVPADPIQLNERMLAQQGQLLCNVGRHTGFSNVILGMLMHTTAEPNQVVSRAVLKRDNRISFLEELQRINIHRASLFPGIDGFAKSLGVKLQIRINREIEARRRETLNYLRARRQQQ